jgi:alkyl hydroperoxide reductase subunit AhpC
MTAMADRYSDFEKAGLSILAISTDDIANLKDSQDNYSKGDIPFPIVSDAAKNVLQAIHRPRRLRGSAAHGTFVLNGKGHILWSDISADPFMDIDFLIKESRRLVSLHK